MPKSKIKSRIVIWEYLASVHSLKSSNKKFSYNLERSKANGHSSQIEKDLKRTIIPQIADEDMKEDFYTSLRHLLTAYTNINPVVGYVQGMNIIGSCLLYNVSDGDFENIGDFEQTAFWLFVALMESYGVKRCFTNKMTKIFELSSSLELIIQNNLPDVLDIINSGDVS